MPEPEEEAKPVSAAKPRDDVYTALQAVSVVVFITAIALVLMELQDKANFGHKLFGQ
jgi:hypothetical protein